MRIWHTIFAVFLTAMGLALCRDPAGRVAIVVFVTGLIEFVLGLAAVMMLFQTVGSIGEARGLLEHVQGLLATAIVLAVGSGGMVVVLGVGYFLLQSVI